MHEVEALLGMRQIMSQSPSLVVLVEWRYLNNLYRTEHTTEQLLEWLDKTGFKWIRYKDGGECKVGTLETLKWNMLLQIEEEDLLLVGPEAKIEELIQI